ncbi:DUF3311 domain-containing protein [Paraburkholderia fynbosensis]|uniref:DUF3311 domain-containing protein n=1 Tax=Paraburkholderia fynbosensis TaxID=1200993 RepID=UPI0031B643AC
MTLRRRPHRTMLVLPFVFHAGLMPLANASTLEPFGIPFPLFWQMLATLLSGGVLGLVYAIDCRVDARERGEGVVH